MSSTTVVLDRMALSDSPSEEALIVDLDSILSPRCPHTRRTFSQFADEALRHSRHYEAKTKKESARQQRKGSRPSEAQRRMLFDESLDVRDIRDAVAGCKFDQPRERAQLKLLKKIRAGKCAASKRTEKSKDARYRPTRRKRRDQFSVEPVDVTAEEMELLGFALFLWLIGVVPENSFEQLSWTV